MKRLSIMLIVFICLLFASCGNADIEVEKAQDKAQGEEIDETSNVYKEAMQVLEETKNIEYENASEGNGNEKIIGRYAINEVYGDESINRFDKIWVLATDIENDFEQLNYYMLIDLDDNIYAKIEKSDNMGWVKGLGDTMIAVRNLNNDKICILDIQGNDITYKWCNDDNEEIILVYDTTGYTIKEDSTGFTIWTRTINETFDMRDVVLRAYDSDGNRKAEWSSEETKNDFGLSSVYFDIKDDPNNALEYVGGSVYRLRGCGYDNNIKYNIHLDVSGRTWLGKGSSSNDGTYTLCYSDRELMITDKGMPVCGGINSTDGLYPDGGISEGLFYARQSSINGTGGYCMVDFTGNIQFYFEYEPLNVPCFHSGKAALTMKGAGGIIYTTLVDTAGNWLFEPVHGKYEMYCKALDMYVIRDDNQLYFLDVNGNKSLYPYEDVLFWIEDGEKTEYAYLSDGILYTKELII